MDKKISRKFLKDSFKEINDEYEKTKELIKETQLSKKSIKIRQGDSKERSLKELIKKAKLDN